MAQSMKASQMQDTMHQIEVINKRETAAALTIQKTSKMIMTMRKVRVKMERR